MTNDTTQPTTTPPTLRTRPRTFARTCARAIAGAVAGAVAALSIAACASGPVVAEPTTSGGGESLALARFGATTATARGGQSDTARVRTVVRTAAEWNAFWASLAPDPAASAGGPPAVDFAKNMVIAAVMPLQPSGGYAVRIARVTEYADRIEAEVIEHVPGAECFTPQVMTRPFDVVQVPRRDGKPVAFQERRATNDCGAPPRADTVRVRHGASVAARGVTVTLLAVPSDSRCPTNAMCIWEGDAAVALRFAASGGRAVDVTLHTSPRGGVVSASVGGVEFTLVGLTPHPIAPGTKPAEAEYTAILAAR